MSTIEYELPLALSSYLIIRQCFAKYNLLLYFKITFICSNLYVPKAIYQTLLGKIAYNTYMEDKDIKNTQKESAEKELLKALKEGEDSAVKYGWIKGEDVKKILSIE